MEPLREEPWSPGGGRDGDERTDETAASAGGGRTPNGPSERRLGLVDVAVLVGIVVAGGALGIWLAASNGINGVDDIIGAPLLGIVLIGFPVLIGWSFFDPGIPIPRNASWGAGIAAVAAGLVALLAGWSVVAVVFTVLGSAFVVCCSIWSIGVTVAETRRRKSGELPPVGAPLAVAGALIASNQQRVSARVVDSVFVYFAVCAAQTLWPGTDQNGFFSPTPWWVIGTFMVYEVASVAWGGSPGKRLFRLRVVRLGADDARWPRVGLIRAMVRTLLVPLAFLNAIIMNLGVNVVHRLDPRLDLLEGTSAGTVVVPKDEVTRLDALGPTERNAVLDELEHELCQRPITVSKKHLAISLVAVAAGVALFFVTNDDETKAPMLIVPTVPTFPVPTFPVPTFPVPTFPVPTLPSIPTGLITVGASTAGNGCLNLTIRRGIPR